MTTTDYLVNAGLILLVLRQIRDRPLDRTTLLLPVIVVAIVGRSYLHDVPTAGNDVVLIAVCVLIGLSFGTLSAMFTRVRLGEDGRAWSKAGAVAATLWIVGVGSRMVFEIFSTHGGAHSVATFSLHHDITSSKAWTAALVLMALTEVVSRLAVLSLRAWRVGANPLARRLSVADASA